MAFRPFKFNLLKELDVKIPKDARQDALEEAANFLKEQMLLLIAEGKSPVTGRAWSGLSKEYKKIKGDSSSVNYANLELTGHLLDNLSVDVLGNNIVIDVDPSDYGKAEGNYLGTYGQKTPVTGQRKFMPQSPDKEKPFTGKILSDLKKLLEEYGE